MTISIYKNFKYKLLLISGIGLFFTGLISEPVKAQVPSLPTFCSGEVEETFKDRCEEIKQQILDATEAALNAAIAGSENTEATSNIILPEAT